MKFRQDINGLRAIAVLAIIFFHFGVPGMKGGFVGVDVFFVISGYLMSAVILGKMAEEKFSLVAFYADRMRRIIPALLFLCCLLLVVGWFILLPFQYALLGKHVVGSLGFISNIVFLREAGYFDLSSHEKWLLHTWSLSVEWQFYLFYPLLILGIRKQLVKRWGNGLILFLMIVSFAFSNYEATLNPDSAFYLLPERTWEFLLGATAFLFPLNAEKKFRIIFEWFGIGLIVASIFTLDSTIAWPGWFAILPTVGTFIVISAARSESNLTGNAIAQFVGKTSYSIYLWHWPVVVALNHFGKLEQTSWCMGGIVFSLVLGYLSFIFIETPARKWGKQANKLFVYGNRRVIAVFAMLVLPVAVLGSGIFIKDGFPGAMRSINSDEKSIFVEKYEEVHRNRLFEAYRGECDFRDWKSKITKTSIDSSCTAGGAMNIFLWGDSHAQALSWGLRHFFADFAPVSQVATSGCAPSIKDIFPEAADNSCNLSNKFALKEIAKLKPEIVVMAQAKSHEKTDWNAIAMQLRFLGVKKIVLVGPMPNWEPSLPIEFVRTHWGNSDSFVKDGLDGSIFKTNDEVEKSYGKSELITYISLTKSLCSSRGCMAIVPGKTDLMVVDYGHLSIAGSEYVADKILGDKLMLLIGESNKFKH